MKALLMLAKHSHKLLHHLHTNSFNHLRPTENLLKKLLKKRFLHNGSDLGRCFGLRLFRAAPSPFWNRRAGLGFRVKGFGFRAGVFVVGAGFGFRVRDAL